MINIFNEFTTQKTKTRQIKRDKGEKDEWFDLLLTDFFARYLHILCGSDLDLDKVLNPY